MTFTEPEVNDPLVINTQITLSVPASDLLPAALTISVSPTRSLTILCKTHMFEGSDKRVKIADPLCVIPLTYISFFVLFNISCGTKSSSSSIFYPEFNSLTKLFSR
jgi:hypothetical protein